MKPSTRRKWRLANRMVNPKIDVSVHPHFSATYELVTPFDWWVRHAAASLALEGVDYRELP